MRTIKIKKSRLDEMIKEEAEKLVEGKQQPAVYDIVTLVSNNELPSLKLAEKARDEFEGLVDTIRSMKNDIDKINQALDKFKSILH